MTEKGTLPSLSRAAVMSEAPCFGGKFDDGLKNLEVSEAI